MHAYQIQGAYIIEHYIPTLFGMKFKQFKQIFKEYIIIIKT